RRVIRHLHAEPLRQADHIAEIASGLRRIDIDPADDLESGARRHLLDDGGPDRAEAEVHHANVRHKLGIVSDSRNRSGKRRNNLFTPGGVSPYILPGFDPPRQTSVIEEECAMKRMLARLGAFVVGVLVAFPSIGRPQTAPPPMVSRVTVTQVKPDML